VLARMGRIARRHAWEVALVLAVLIGVHAYKTRDHPSDAPVIEARLLDGREIMLGGPHLRPRLLHFWATWCGVCRMEEGSVEALSHGADVVSVAVRSGSGAEVQRYMQERGLTFPVVNDPDGVLSRAHGVHAYPTSFFVSPDGRITTSEVGYTTALGLRLRLWLASW